MTPASLTWRVKSNVLVEGTTAGLALLAAAISGDFVLVAFAAPLALAVVAGLGSRRPEAPGVAVAVSPAITAPGEPITVSITLRAATAGQYEVSLPLSPGLEAKGDTSFKLRLRGGEEEELSIEVTARRPGRFLLGSLALRVTNLTGCLLGTGKGGEAVTVEVRPVGSPLLSVVRPERVRATAGDRVAKLAADGIEIADVREQPEGAFGRRINWRATARRQVTCVNVHHPERSTDIVLLVDTFAESQIPSAVTIAVNLAESYSRRHDRLGLVCFGGVLDWVEPGTGPAHLERVRRALLSSEAFFSYAWKTADIIPRRLFPAGCLVIAISPLGDDRFTGALASLRSRRVDLAVVELAPPATIRGDSTLALASRIVAMEREELRRRFFRIGIPVVSVGGPAGVAGALAEIAAFRRSNPSRPAIRL